MISTVPRYRSWFWRFTGNYAAIGRWAEAEAERTRPPVCARESCYSGPDVVASRIAHGCIPDWKRTA